MDTILLRDPLVHPSKEVLAKALGKSYNAYEQLMEIISEPGYGLIPQWNYYKDGKAWLCKVCFKNKTYG